MTILHFLQQNAEWMCAMAIVAFTAVQCWLTYQQNMQNIRMKRLELAGKLDEVAAQFMGEKEEARLVRTWLVSNASNFAFLLNERDIVKYKALCCFVMNYLNPQNIPNREEMVEAIKKLLELVGELDSVLCNAKYDFVKVDKELCPKMRKNNGEKN